MYICEVCGKEIPAAETTTEVITRTDTRNGETIHLCRGCFKEQMGVDYDDYAKRKNKTKLGCVVFPLSIVTTVFLFWKFGLWLGISGLVITFIVYKFFTKNADGTEDYPVSSSTRTRSVEEISERLARLCFEDDAYDRFFNIASELPPEYFPNICIEYLRLRVFAIDYALYLSLDNKSKHSEIFDSFLVTSFKMLMNKFGNKDISASVFDALEDSVTTYGNIMTFSENGNKAAAEMTISLFKFAGMDFRKDKNAFENDPCFKTVYGEIRLFLFGEICSLIAESKKLVK